jgi:hypothetical protein
MRAHGDVTEAASVCGGGGTLVPRPGGEADKFGNRYETAWTQVILRLARQRVNVIHAMIRTGALYGPRAHGDVGLAA